jgi:hypothetical protein
MCLEKVLDDDDNGDHSLHGWYNIIFDMTTFFLCFVISNVQRKPEYEFENQI